MNTQTVNKLTYTMTRITPEVATEMLKQNTHNRTVNKAHVTRLATEMQRGRWKVNGDTICRTPDRLVDGQHRLHAVILSGVAIDVLVVDGLSPDVFQTKDVGRRRSASDTLFVAGEANTCRLAAALALIDAYHTHRVEAKVGCTNTEIEALLLRYPEARVSVDYGARHRSRLVLPSVLDACHYIFARLDPTLADSFVVQVTQGLDIVPGSPFHLLRERMIKNAASKGTLSRAYIMALCIKAWNYTRRNRKVSTLAYAQGGSSPEAFPIAI